MDFDALTSYLSNTSSSFRDSADAVFVVEGQRLPIHKAIVAVNSPVLAGLFASINTTNQQAEFPLDDTLEIVRTALVYLYQKCTTRLEHIASSQDAIWLATFAHKYNVRDLPEICEDFLVRQIANEHKYISKHGIIVDWLLLAEKCGMDRLAAECEFFIFKNEWVLFGKDSCKANKDVSRDSLLRMLKANKVRKATANNFLKWRREGIPQVFHYDDLL